MPSTAAAAKVIRIELDNFDPDAFEVLSFSATEGLSKLFSYSITLAAKEPISEFDDLLSGKAHLFFGDPAIHVHGMLSSAQQGYDGAWQAGSGKRTRVDIVLVPDMWKLTLTARTKFFRDMSVKDVITAVLGEHGLKATLDLSGDHPVKKSILQYQETDFDFLQRLCEHEGIHFHFLHEESEETIVFADHNGPFATVEGAASLPLRSPKQLEGKANMGSWGEEWTIQRFQSRQRFVPKKVVLQDYNDQTPSKDLKVEKEGDDKGTDGSVYMFGEHYKDTGEGSAVGELRLEEIQARKRLFFGTSNVFGLFAGGVFKLDMEDAGLSVEYVITELHAEGTQPVEHTSGSSGFLYANSFTCIPKSIVWRPEVTTEWPEMQGLYHAKVLGSGDYANVEGQGRYEVQFLFDIDKAGSIPVRLMEPYVGPDYGFHAPLHEGVEVLVGFENGDPDRPIIVAAAHNPDNPNTVKDANNPQSVFRSAGNNELRFDDTKGGEEVYLHGEKDWKILIENDKTQNIGNDEKLDVGRNRTKDVGQDETITIGSNKSERIGANHAETVGANQTIDVASNKAESVGVASSEMVGAAKTVSVGAAYALSVGAAMTETVGAAKSVTVAGNITTEVAKNLTETTGKDRKIIVKGLNSEEVTKDYSLLVKKKMIIESNEEIVLKSGSASITLKKDGTIIIDGKDVTIKASGGISAKASKDVVMKGSKVLAN